MRTLRRELFLFMGMLLLAPVELLAQNTSSATAAFLTIGQQAVVQPLANNTSEGWFVLFPRPGRSYCASITLSASSAFFTSGITPGDPAVFVLDTNSAVVSTNDGNGEPFGLSQARACFIWNSSLIGYVVAVQNTNSPNIYDVRVIETTMFCPWFYIAGDYSAFTLIRNTTESPVSFTVKWRNPAGAIVGTFSGAVAGNGNTFLDARTFVNPATTPSGSIEIAHNGSEDALKASTTTLSGTTGLSFDAVFEQRRSQ